MKNKTMKVGALARAGSIDKASINEDDRTVEVAFSSETSEVRRWFGVEILDHSPESVDLDRMNNGAPLLMDHNPTDQIGVIESARVDDDRVARAVVRFSRSARADEIFQDVRDGIRTKISVGYSVREMTLQDSSDDGPDVYRVNSWQPFENSFVSVPADDSVGVGRAMETEAFARHFGDLASMETRILSDKTPEVTKMSKKDNAPAPAAPVAPTVDEDAVRAESRANELARVNEIMDVGTKYGMMDEARTAINNDSSLADFREMVLDKVEERNKAPANTAGSDEIPAEELRHYSLLKAVRAQMTGDWSKAGFEAEVSNECMERMKGKTPNGFYVPHEVFGRGQSVGTAAEGGNLVATDLRGDSFIELLRANSLAGSVGVTYLPGLVGNLDIPKQTTGGAFSFIDEDDDSPETDIEIGLVPLTPETISGSVYMTRRSLMQTTPAIESLVRADIIRGMGLGIDAAIFEGDGLGNNPTGVSALAGVNTVTVSSAGTPTYAELVQFETKVDADNALEGNLHYVTTPTVWGNIRTTAVDAGSGVYLSDKVGYQVHRSTQLAANRIMFGNWSNVMVGLWGALDINVDAATRAAKGGIYLRAFQDANTAAGHAAGFSVNA